MNTARTCLDCKKEFLPKLNLQFYCFECRFKVPESKTETGVSEEQRNKCFQFFDPLKTENLMHPACPECHGRIKAAKVPFVPKLKIYEAIPELECSNCGTFEPIEVYLDCCTWCIDFKCMYCPIEVEESEVGF